MEQRPHKDTAVSSHPDMGRMGFWVAGRQALGHSSEREREPAGEASKGEVNRVPDQEDSGFCLKTVGGGSPMAPWCSHI